MKEIHYYRGHEHIVAIDNTKKKIFIIDRSKNAKKGKKKEGKRKSRALVTPPPSEK